MFESPKLLCDFSKETVNQDATQYCPRSLWNAEEEEEVHSSNMAFSSYLVWLQPSAVRRSVHDHTRRQPPPFNAVFPPGQEKGKRKCRGASEWILNIHL
jgi:hypothetical protein